MSDIFHDSPWKISNIFRYYKLQRLSPMARGHGQCISSFAVTCSHLEQGTASGREQVTEQVAASDRQSKWPQVADFAKIKIYIIYTLSDFFQNPSGPICPSCVIVFLSIVFGVSRIARKTKQNKKHGKIDPAKRICISCRCWGLPKLCNNGKLFITILQGDLY